MKGVILDKSTFHRNDIELSGFLKYPVEWSDYLSTSRKETRDRIAGKQIIVTNKVVIDKDLLNDNHDLKLIMIAATGTDNVDIELCRQMNITVCNVRSYATPAVVQHTFALMLNLLTNQIKYIDDVKNQMWSGSEIFCLLDHPIVELEGKSLGIIGYGTLGSRVAAVARAFGMEILICQRPGTKPRKSQKQRIPFDQILERSDVLTLHCPLTPETNNLLGKKEFTRMKSSAIVINTARGAIINSEALVSALKTDVISGAGIDVLTHEPPPDSDLLLQGEIPNLIVTPHNAWGTRESRQRLVDQLARILGGWFDNKPINCVT